MRIARDMRVLPRVKIPRNYPAITSRRVHVAEWVDGEKLSQSTADNVGDLVNLGVVTYLTQLLEGGFFHADPHPGNMLRTPDGRLAILDFGLMTEVTDEQKYGMIEAIAHLVHRDYDNIGDDFVRLGFIPPGTDLAPIVPALSNVFDAALAGGGAKSINFQDLAADLAQITFEYPFRIPPYFALVIRAISVLEGIALVANPEFAIIDEAYPYISQRLLTDPSPRLRSALRYMVYGAGDELDMARLIDLLQNFERFVAVKDDREGAQGVSTRGLESGASAEPSPAGGALVAATAGSATAVARTRAGSVGYEEGALARDALRFFFSGEGAFFRGLVLDETVKSVDALSRDAVLELLGSLPGAPSPPPLVRALAPPLTDDDRRVVENVRQLLDFLVVRGEGEKAGEGGAGAGAAAGGLASVERARSLLPLPPQLGGFGARALDPSGAGDALSAARALAPTLQELSPAMRDFARELTGRLFEQQAARGVRFAADTIFGPSPSRAGLPAARAA